MKKQTFIESGNKFGRLTAIEYSHTGKHNRRYFRFKCECGNETIITAEAAISGNTKSCGCLSTEVKKGKRLPDNHSDITAIILGYKRHAEVRGLKFLLERDFVNKIVRQNCFYCGSVPSNLKKTKNNKDGFLYNGIDRIDSNQNYTNNNVVPCCDFCNKAKGNRTKQEFLDQIKKIYEYQKTMGAT